MAKLLQPEGVYYAHVNPAPEKHGASQYEGTGNEYFFVGLVITHEAIDGKWKALNNPLEKEMHLQLGDKAYPFTEKKLKALGFNFDATAPRFGDDAYNKGFEVNCSHYTKGSKTMEQWDLAKWGAERQPMNVARLNSLNARFKMSVAPASGSAPPAMAPPPMPTASAAPQPTSMAPPPMSTPAPAPAITPTSMREAAWAGWMLYNGQFSKPYSEAELKVVWGKVLAQYFPGVSEDRIAVEQWQWMKDNVEALVLPF